MENKENIEENMVENMPIVWHEQDEPMTMNCDYSVGVTPSDSTKEPDQEWYQQICPMLSRINTYYQAL